MNINLGNYHKVLDEIRLRKTDRTKFLMLLRNNLEDYLDDLDIYHVFINHFIFFLKI
ncbi:hypothetical protein CMU84_08275 [Elizabethkingia anophelis]|nr:hypothetical protein [Elizabethkingia anophelis]MDV3706763.1 hypothetical protein [Elizabethkingia anophelis]MDV3735220.1 hypothetical protein [Elizabethkingia anophelis]